MDIGEIIEVGEVHPRELPYLEPAEKEEHGNPTRGPAEPVRRTDPDEAPVPDREREYA